MTPFTVETHLADISYDAFLNDISALAEIILASEWAPDLIVGVGRGGLVPATYLSHRLQITMLSVDHSSQVPDFADHLLSKLAGMTVAGQKVLVVDDINDSGSTIAYLRRRLAEAGGLGRNLRFGVLIDNIRSVEHVDYRSRTIDRSVNKSWFVFPWETVAPRSVMAREAGEVPGRLA
jgi:uncharacterized protein